MSLETKIPSSMIIVHVHTYAMGKLQQLYLRIPLYPHESSQLQDADTPIPSRTADEELPGLWDPNRSCSLIPLLCSLWSLHHRSTDERWLVIVGTKSDCDIFLLVIAE